MKTVCIHQPNFMPWLGFFDKASKSDLLIILDHVQYEKNSVINRNLIKTAQGPKWLTVPVKAHLSQSIDKVLIDESRNWRKDHLKTILINYKKAPNFDQIYPLIEQIYSLKIDQLSEFNLKWIELFFELLQIKTEIIKSSQFTVLGHKNELLINLIQKFQGDSYLSGKGAKNYLNEELFKKAEIKVFWQEYKGPIYPQLFGEFVPNLSVLDFVFCADYKNYFAK